MNKVHLPAVCVKENRGSDRRAVLSVFYSSSYLLCVSILLSHLMTSSHLPLLHLLCSFLLFLSPVLLLILLPRSLYFPTSPSHLLSSCFSLHLASHPRGDSEQWIYSNAGW